MNAKGLRQEHALVWIVVQSDWRAVNAGRLTRDEWWGANGKSLHAKSETLRRQFQLKHA